jgi:hypothetical protein
MNSYAGANAQPGNGRRRAFGVASGVGALGIALALVLAGCGGGKSASTAATSSSTAPVAASSASSSPAAAASVSAAGGARTNADFQKYTACLTQHGVTVPSFSARPGGSGRAGFGSGRPRVSGSARPQFSGSARPRGSGAPGGFGGGIFGGGSQTPAEAAAAKACASLLPAGGFGGAGGRAGGAGAISATTLASFKSCMSSNGVTLTGTTATQVLASLNRSDAKTAAALKVCQPILGTAAAGSGAPAPAPAAS